jgi:hypothetical protein
MPPARTELSAGHRARVECFSRRGATWQMWCENDVAFPELGYVDRTKIGPKETGMLLKPGRIRDDRIREDRSGAGGGT